LASKVDQESEIEGKSKIGGTCGWGGGGLGLGNGLKKVRNLGFMEGQEGGFQRKGDQEITEDKPD